MKIKKELFIFLVLIFQLIPVKFWLSCKSFLDSIHFSSYDLQLQLLDHQSRDFMSPVYLTRFFHNKVTQFSLDVYKRYTQFLDLRLFISLMTFVGIFGVLLAFWYFLSAKRKSLKVGLLILMSLLMPLIEVIFNPSLPFTFKFIIFALPFEILSLYGHYQFIREKNAKFFIPIYLILFILSLLWFFSLPDLIYSFCVRQ